MPKTACRIVALAEMVHGQEADLFVLLSSKETLSTREGKPYERVTFRDAAREVSFPIWDNSPWAAECRANWTPGTCYKLRAVYRDTSYGPQLDIRKIRPVVDDDAEDGFDPSQLRPCSRVAPETMFQELLALVHEHIADDDLRELTEAILDTHQAELLALPASRQRHHAYRGGWLEHTLGVARTVLFWSEQYAEPFATPGPLDTSLAVAGAVLHDIGLLRELEWEQPEPGYTPAGELIGHLLLGRDLVREAAAGRGLAAETLLRLEHLIVAHDGLSDGGGPRAALTAEALLVQAADALDARLDLLAHILRDISGPASLTSAHNPLRQKVYRGRRPAGGEAAG